MSIFHPFLPNSKLWPPCVGGTCSPRTIWHWGFGKYHLKSSQLKRFGHRTITSFGGSKKPFFWSGVGGWNNHLQIFKQKDMIQFHVFWNYFFLWIVTLKASIGKTKLDGMFIFRCWFFENFSFWRIKSADLQDSGHQFKIWTCWRLYNYLI